MQDFHDSTIRFPKDLHERIKHLAEKNHRSFSKEVVYILENSRQVNSTKDLKIFSS